LCKMPMYKCDGEIMTLEYRKADSTRVNLDLTVLQNSWRIKAENMYVRFMLCPCMYTECTCVSVCAQYLLITCPYVYYLLVTCPYVCSTS
jgi:hypothetical protein